MKIGIIGLGSIGKRHAENLIEMGERELMAHDPAWVDKLYGYKAGCVPVVSLEDMWAWKPEVVLVCTPPTEHYELVMEALLDRQCHVFCEKPLAITHDMARHIVANVGQQVLAVGYQLRWSMQEFRHEASGQKDIAYLCVQNMSSWPSAYQKDVLDEFSHEIDAAQWIRGPVEAVMAKRFGDVWNINLRHLAGFSYVRIGDVDDVSLRKAYTCSKDVQWEFNQAENDQAYKEELRAFLDACEGKPWDDRLCSGAEAAHVCRIIEACRESAKNCSVVRL